MRALLAYSGLGLALACGPRPGSTPGEDQKFGHAPGTLDGARFLGADAQRARKAGAGQSEVLTVEPGASGDRVTSLFWVPTTECALVIARASESVDDIDLFVYGDDGTSFGSDEAPDKSPSVLLCPPHPRRMLAVARVASGHGVVALGVQRVPKSQAAAVRRSIKSRTDKSASLRERARVNARVADHRQQLGGRWRELRRIALPADARVPTRSSLALRADRCIDVLAVPSRGVGPMDLDLINSDGRVVGRGYVDGRDRFVVACSGRDTHLTVQLRPRSGSGTAWLMVAESEVGAQATLASYAGLIDLGPVQTLAKTRAQLEESLGKQPYAAARVLYQGTLKTGLRSSVVVPKAPGCRRVDVIGGTPLFGMRTWAYSDGGLLLAQAQGAGRTSMLLCGNAPARLDLEAQLSPGPVVAVVRGEPDPPPVLSKHPLAASRLMSAVWSRGSAILSREISGVVAKQLSPTALARAQVRVPLRRCVDFFAALDRGAYGLELRLLDVQSNQELSRSHGSYAASARLCTDKGTIDARVELEVQSGRAPALFATRMTNLTPRASGRRSQGH